MEALLKSRSILFLLPGASLRLVFAPELFPSLSRCIRFVYLQIRLRHHGLRRLLPLHPMQWHTLRQDHT